MKNFRKAVGLALIGLSVAIFVYPFLHEAGHALMSIFTGTCLVEVSLLPLPHITTAAVEKGNMAAVGAGGILLPSVLACAFYPRRFHMWYVGFVLRLICLWSFVLAMYSALCFAQGRPCAADDITTLLEMGSVGWQGCFLTALICAAGMLLSVISTRPAKRCIAYFAISEG